MMLMVFESSHVMDRPGHTGHNMNCDSFPICNNLGFQTVDVMFPGEEQFCLRKFAGWSSPLLTVASTMSPQSETFAPVVQPS
jgi:hypothetical protein